LTYIFGTLVYLEILEVMFVGQGHKSRFKVIEGNVLFQPIVAAGCVGIASVHFHYFFGYITRISLIFVLTCLPTYGEAYRSSGLWFYAAVC